MRTVAVLLGLAAWLCCVPAGRAQTVAASPPPLLFVVNAPRGVEEVQRWQVLAQAFGGLLGRPLALEARSPTAVLHLLKAGQPDLVLANPVGALAALDTGLYEAVGTVAARGVSQFAGAIITHRHSGIRRLEDLRGRDVLAFRHGASAGAFVFPYYHLLQAGIAPRRDLRSLRESRSQDDIVLAVASGFIDAGMVRSGLLEAMLAEGRIREGEVLVLDERRDALPYRHTTALYPEWFLLLRRDLPGEQREALRALALGLRPDSPAAQAAGIDGFVPPEGLDELQRVIAAVQEAERAAGHAYGSAMPVSR